MALNLPGIAATVANDVDGLSLHSADPGTTGANQVGDKTAVTPATDGADVTIPSTDFTGLPASTAVTHAGLWAGSTFLAGAPLTGDQAANAAGQYTVASFTFTDSANA